MSRDQQQENPARKRRADSEAIEWQEYPRIGPGEYRAYCKFGKHYRDPGFRRWLCLLRWDVLTDDACNVVACVPQFFALGNGAKPRASRRGTYFPEWVRASGGPPTRGDRLSPQVFTHRVARVLIADTEKSAMPYSVVREIIEWETGSPGSSVNKSHNQGRQAANPQLERGSLCSLSPSPASALAGVEGSKPPTHTQGAGVPIQRRARQRQSQHTTAKDYESAASMQATDFTRSEMARDLCVTNPKGRER